MDCQLQAESVDLPSTFPVRFDFRSDVISFSKFYKQQRKILLNMNRKASKLLSTIVSIRLHICKRCQFENCILNGKTNRMISSFQGGRTFNLFMFYVSKGKWTVFLIVFTRRSPFSFQYAPVYSV